MAKSRAIRLRWNGNNAAQAEADKAYLEWRAKSGSAKGKKKAPKPKRIRNRKPYIRADGSVDYRKYIDSRDWQRKKAGLLERRGSKCERCGGSYRIHIHHKTYRRLGRERDKDLEVLCSGCHSNEHEGENPTIMDPMTKAYLSALGLSRH